MPFLYLAVAIIAEVIGTSALKASNGFSVWLPSLVVVAGYGVSFYFLSLALRAIPVGRSSDSGWMLRHSSASD
jgi:small multidrug resistance pump